MTKSELIDKIINKYSNIPIKTIKYSIKKIIKYMEKCISNGKRIEIRNFGSFSIRFRKAKIGRNPKTGESINLKKTFIPFFKIGKNLKKKINS